VNAEQALSAKMVDRIDTLQGVIAKLAAGRIRIASTSVNDDWNAPTVQELRASRLDKIRALASMGDA